MLRQEVDDPNEPYSDIDEELMAMAVPEPAIVSHLMSRLTKPSGFYGHWLDERLTYKDKVVLRKLGREVKQEQGRRRSEANQ